jgi:Mn-dependent DtxR family transcriptional regulator
MLLFPIAMIESVWTDADDAILECLRTRGAMSPVGLAERLGISPGECTTLLCLLATQGKVKIGLVELDEEESEAQIPAIRKRREAIRRRA